MMFGAFKKTMTKEFEMTDNWIYALFPWSRASESKKGKAYTQRKICQSNS